MRREADASHFLLSGLPMSDSDQKPDHSDESLPELDLDALRDAKLRSLAEFAAGAGHEINNPLATILGRVELLLRRLDRGVTVTGAVEETRRDLQIIAGQAQRIRDMIGDLMLFARPPAPRLEALDISAITQAAIAPLAVEAANAGVQLHFAPSKAAVVRADRVQLTIVICELVRNAIAACSERGHIDLSTQTVSRGNQSVVRLQVEDNGRGFSPVDREHAFDPFYSGRNAGRGLGFGLCKCWRILERHGGRIGIDSGSNSGTIVWTEWPPA
jgi:signal transduction histidine kinase